MSGSGGFYKYRCKYFLTHDCPNWVFVNYAPCADCCAAGRDMDDDMSDGPPGHLFYASPEFEFEIGVPVFQDGILHYTLAEIAVSIAPGADFASWTHRPPLRGSAGGGADGGAPFPHEIPPSPHPPQQPHHHLQRQQQLPPHLHLPNHHIQQQHQQQHHHSLHLQPQQLQFQLQQQQQQLQQHHHQQQHQQQSHQLLKLQGGSPRQGAKMQLPPHAASKAFPVSTAAGPMDVPQASSPGMPLVY